MSFWDTVTIAAESAKEGVIKAAKMNPVTAPLAYAPTILQAGRGLAISAGLVQETAEEKKQRLDALQEKTTRWETAGYKASEIFQGKNANGIDTDALIKNPQWLKAVAISYEALAPVRQTGMSTTEIALMTLAGPTLGPIYLAFKEGSMKVPFQSDLSFLNKQQLEQLKQGQIPKDLKPEQLHKIGTWGLESAAHAESNIGNLGVTFATLMSKGTPEQAAAFQFLTEAYEQKNANARGVLRQTMGMATDLTTWAGLFTGGEGLVVRQGAKEMAGTVIREGMKDIVEQGLTGAAREAAKQQVRREAIKTTLTAQAKTHGAVAAEGAAYMAASDSMRQNIGMKAGVDKEFSWSRFFTSTATGGAFGAGASVGLPYVFQGIGKMFNSVTGRTKAGGDLANEFADSAIVPEGAAPQASSTRPKPVQDPATVRTTERSAANDGPAPHTPDPETAHPRAANDDPVNSNSQGDAQAGIPRRDWTPAERRAGRPMRAPDHPNGGGPRQPGAGAADPDKVQLPRGKTLDEWLDDDPARATWFDALPEAQRRRIERLAGDGKPFTGPEARARNAGANSNGASNAAIPPINPQEPKTDYYKTHWGLAGAQAGRTGITLPDFHLGFDWIKVKTRRNLDLFKAFTTWDFPVKAARIRSTGVVRPVIEATDNFMRDSKITEALKTLQEDILKEVDGGAPLSSIESKIDAFANTHRGDLQKFRDGVAELRKHVDETYGITEKSTLRFGLTKGQKAELLQRLDNMQQMADDLALGASGKNGRQMLQTVQNIRTGQTVTVSRATGGKDNPTVTGEEILSTDIIRNSPNGLSQANKLATDSQIRIDGKWPAVGLGTKPSPVTAQYREAAEREIDYMGYDSRYSNSTYVTYSALQKENLEQVVQNEILETFAERDANGIPTYKFNTTEHSDQFVTPFIKLYDLGYKHEAFEAIYGLRALRQAIKERDFKGAAASEYVLSPSKSALESSFKKDHRYGKDEAFTNWANEFVSRSQGQVPGRHVAIFDLFFGDTRTGRHLAYALQYRNDFAWRWRGTGSWWSPLAKPGNIAVKDEIFNTTKRLWSYFLGAQKAERSIENRFGMNMKGVSGNDIVWGAEGESALRRPVRALSRIFTGGALSDPALLRSWKPWQALGNKQFMGIGSGYVAGVGGLLLGLGAVGGVETSKETGQSLISWGTAATPFTISTAREIGNGIVLNAGRLLSNTFAGTNFTYHAGLPNLTYNGLLRDSGLGSLADDKSPPQTEASEAAPAASGGGQVPPQASPSPAPTASATPVKVLTLKEQFECLDGPQQTSAMTLARDLSILRANFGNQALGRDDYKQKDLELTTMLINGCINAGKTPAELGL